MMPKLGDFLTQDKPVESILDKLVSTTISQQSFTGNIETEKVIAPDSSESKPDERLLSDLSKSLEPSGPDSGAGEKGIETKSVESQPSEPEHREQDIKKSVLDQLMGKSDSQSENDQTDKSQAGETGDA